MGDMLLLDCFVHVIISLCELDTLHSLLLLPWLTVRGSLVPYHGNQLVYYIKYSFCQQIVISSVIIIA